MSFPLFDFLGFVPLAAEITQQWESAGVLLAKLGAIALLVFLNGFFVAAEFALVKVRSSQLEALSAEGNMGAGSRAAGHGEPRRLSLGLPARHHPGQPRPRLGGRAVPRAHAPAALRHGLDRVAGHHPRDFVRARLFHHHVSSHRARRTGAEDSRDPQGAGHVDRHQPAVAALLHRLSSRRSGS